MYHKLALFMERQYHFLAISISFACNIN